LGKKASDFKGGIGFRRNIVTNYYDYVFTGV
jgi:hypothetical protein